MPETTMPLPAHRNKWRRGVVGVVETGVWAALTASLAMSGASVSPETRLSRTWELPVHSRRCRRRSTIAWQRPCVLRSVLLEWSVILTIINFSYCHCGLWNARIVSHTLTSKSARFVRQGAALHECRIRSCCHARRCHTLIYMPV